MGGVEHLVGSAPKETVEISRTALNVKVSEVKVRARDLGEYRDKFYLIGAAFLTLRLTEFQPPSHHSTIYL